MIWPPKLASPPLSPDQVGVSVGYHRACSVSSTGFGGTHGQCWWSHEALETQGRLNARRQLLHNARFKMIKRWKLHASLSRKFHSSSALAVQDWQASVACPKLDACFLQADAQDGHNYHTIGLEHRCIMCHILVTKTRSSFTFPWLRLCPTKWHMREHIKPGVGSGMAYFCKQSSLGLRPCK